MFKGLSHLGIRVLQKWECSNSLSFLSGIQLVLLF
jgi:hypothetical protein